MATLVVPDTNIFLHYQAFNTVPWNEVIGDTDVVLLVIVPVIEELDKKKRDPRLSNRARSVLSTIESLMDTDADATLDNGIQAKIDGARPLGDLLNAHQLDPASGDDKILATMIQLKEEGADVVLVTGDVAVRVRAQSLDIAIKRMPPEYERPSADPQAAKYKKMQRELDVYRKAMPVLALEFVGSGNLLQVPTRRPPKQTSSLGDALAFSPLDYNSLPSSYGITREPPTPEGVADYNERLEAMKPRIEEYYAQKRRYQLFPYRSLPITLLLKNTGGKPSGSVAVTLTIPGDVRVLLDDELPEEPKRPDPPPPPGKLRRTRTRGAPLSILEKLNGVHANQLSGDVRRALFDLGPPPDPACQRKSKDDGTEELVFTLKQIPNFEEVQLDRFYLVFATTEKRRNIGVDYKIRAANLSKLVEGRLNVVMATVPDEKPPEGESG